MNLHNKKPTYFEEYTELTLYERPNTKKKNDVFK